MTVIFFRAKRDDCMQVRSCLERYERASGQLVNYDKSALDQLSNDIKSILSVQVVKGYELYLGLPTFSLYQKRLQFAYLRERICKKIQG